MDNIRVKVYDFFSPLASDNRCLYIDTFAVICVLHQRGDKDAALKLLPDLFKAVGTDLNCDYKRLLKLVVSNIDGNEQLLISSVPTRLEFTKLSRS